MDAWQLAVFGLVGFCMSILSGISGAGGGLIMTPLAIFLGLSPAQAVSSGKFNGLAVTIGTLTGLRKYGRRASRAKIAALMALAFAVGLIVPHIIKSFDSDWYRLTLGVILLLMIPIMIHRRIGAEPGSPSTKQKTLGGVLLTISLFLQGTFSGGLGSLVNIVLMGMLGMTAIEAQITKRWSQLILNSTIILGLLSSGLIVWPVVVVGSIVFPVGGYIGGHLAVRHGDRFAANVMLILVTVAALVLIFGTL